MSKHEELVASLVAEIQTALPDVKLKFEEINDYLTVKPEGWLGSEGFSKVQAKILELKGEYVSAGKLSHFRIPLELKPEQNLKEWYDEQERLTKPLQATLNINVNLQVTSPTQLEELLKTLKKHIG